MAAIPQPMKTFSSRRRRCALGPIHFRRVSKTLASSCNLGSCAEPPTAALVADGSQENNNEITVEMRETGDPQRMAGRARPNVRPPGSEPASMRKFGEYAFLEDSRYARQAKSAASV